MSLERIVQIDPALDRRHPDPTKSQGISGAELRFIVKGERGAVHFCIYTHWFLPQNKQEISPPRSPMRYWWKPDVSDLSYHSKTRLSESDYLREGCDWLDGEPCYWSGSYGFKYLEEVFETLIREGSDGLWKLLEEFYRETFEVKDN